MAIKFSASSAFKSPNAKFAAASGAAVATFGLGLLLGGGGTPGHDVPFLNSNYPTGYNKEYTNLSANKPDEQILNFINNNLFSGYVPDISGYTLVFMVPPELSGYDSPDTTVQDTFKVLDQDSVFEARKSLANEDYKRNDKTPEKPRNPVTDWVAKMIPFLATQFTPPQLQMGSSTLAASSASQQYASELQITDSMSISFMETSDLDVYSFHRNWVNYIFEVLEGNLKPGFMRDQKPGGDYLVSTYIDDRRIDYAAAFYFVKFRPDMSTLTYIGKAVGCFPKELPSAELLGNRSSNELTTVTFNYAVSDYREYTFREAAANKDTRDKDPRFLKYEIINLFSKYGDGIPYFDPVAVGLVEQGVNALGGAIKLPTPVKNLAGSLASAADERLGNKRKY